MDFGQSLRPLVKGQSISMWDRQSLSRLTARDHDLMTRIIDRLGFLSAKAQGLHRVITSADKLRLYPQRLYLAVEKDCSVLGFLKTGFKKLFLTNPVGEIIEVEPLCCLDFYVHESVQRQGIGYSLLQFMFQQEGIRPPQMAIDRPSEKLLGLMRKYYGLYKFTPQVNNFVVFDEFMDTPAPDPDSLPARPTTAAGVPSSVRVVEASGAMAGPHTPPGELKRKVSRGRGRLFEMSALSPFAEGHVSPDGFPARETSFAAYELARARRVADIPVARRETTPKEEILRQESPPFAGTLSDPQKIVKEIRASKGRQLDRAEGRRNPKTREPIAQRPVRAKGVVISSPKRGSYAPPVEPRAEFVPTSMNDSGAGTPGWDQRLGPKLRDEPCSRRRPGTAASPSTAASRTSRAELIRQYYRLKEAPVATIAPTGRGYGTSFYH